MADCEPAGDGVPSEEGEQLEEIDESVRARVEAEAVKRATDRWENEKSGLANALAKMVANMHLNTNAGANATVTFRVVSDVIQMQAQYETMRQNIELIKSKGYAAAVGVDKPPKFNKHADFATWKAQFTSYCESLDLPVEKWGGRAFSMLDTETAQLFLAHYSKGEVFVPGEITWDDFTRVMKSGRVAEVHLDIDINALASSMAYYSIKKQVLTPVILQKMQTIFTKRSVPMDFVTKIAYTLDALHPELAADVRLDREDQEWKSFEDFYDAVLKKADEFDRKHPVSGPAGGAGGEWQRVVRKGKRRGSEVNSHPIAVKSARVDHGEAGPSRLGGNEGSPFAYIPGLNRDKLDFLSERGLCVYCYSPDHRVKHCPQYLLDDPKVEILPFDRAALAAKYPVKYPRKGKFGIGNGKGGNKGGGGKPYDRKGRGRAMINGNGK